MTQLNLSSSIITNVIAIIIIFIITCIIKAIVFRIQNATPALISDASSSLNRTQGHTFAWTLCVGTALQPLHMTWCHGVKELFQGHLNLLSCHQRSIPCLLLQIHENDFLTCELWNITKCVRNHFLHHLFDHSISHGNSCFFVRRLKLFLNAYLPSTGTRVVLPVTATSAPFQLK